MKPNILLIVSDEFRGDCMGCAGHPDVKTPYLDDLAARGVYFPNTYSACPTCIPARASLYTGLAPRRTGRVGYQDGVDWNYRATLAGELGCAGYQTHCVGKLHVHPLRDRVGFDAVDLHEGYLHRLRNPGIEHRNYQKNADDYFADLRARGRDIDVTDGGPDCDASVARPWMHDERDHPTNWVTTRAVDFLRRRDARKPFFLMASYIRPHAPYDAPRWYFDMYGKKALRPPASGAWNDRARLAREGALVAGATGPSDPELIREQMVGYYACITHLDHQIGRLINGLREHGVLNDTVILFAADHGSMLSDHGLAHKGLPYQGSARVPLILAGPETLVGAPGRADARLCALCDIMPTLLHAAGADAPYPLDGLNLLGAAQRAHLHGEHEMDGGSNQFIVTARDKYIWFSRDGREQYFDLEADPREAVDGISDPACAPRVEALRSALVRALDGRIEGYCARGKLIPGRAARPMLPWATQSEPEGSACTEY